MSGDDWGRIGAFWFLTTLAGGVLCSVPGAIIGVIGWGLHGLWFGALVGIGIGAGLLSAFWIYVLVRMLLRK
jgi:hypothetical protein